MRYLMISSLVMILVSAGSGGVRAQDITFVLDYPFDVKKHPLHITTAPPPPPNRHTGWRFESTDFALPFGAPILAVAYGRIIHITDDVPDGNPASTSLSCSKKALQSDPSLGRGCMGNFVTILHNEGTKLQFYATYMHLKQGSASHNQVGTTVFGQAIIGSVGHTGPRTGPHLHFQPGLKLLKKDQLNDSWFAGKVADGSKSVRRLVAWKSTKSTNKGAVEKKTAQPAIKPAASKGWTNRLGWFSNLLVSKKEQRNRLLIKQINDHFEKSTTAGCFKLDKLERHKKQKSTFITKATQTGKLQALVSAGLMRMGGAAQSDACKRNCVNFALTPNGAAKLKVRSGLMGGVIVGWTAYEPASLCVGQESLVEITNVVESQNMLLHPLPILQVWFTSKKTHPKWIAGTKLHTVFGAKSFPNRKYKRRVIFGKTANGEWKLFR